MLWAGVIAAVVLAAAVLFYFRGRQKRRNDCEIITGSDAETGFYPEIEKCHEINTKTITCSCLEFRKERAQFPHDDPRRLCKHLVRSFTDAQSLPENLILYKEGVERSAEAHCGFPANKTRFDEHVGGERIAIMIPEETNQEDPWIDVYCEAKQFRFSPEREMWADENVPAREEQAIRFLYEKLGRSVPEGMLRRSKNATRAFAEGKERAEGGADGKPGICRDVESVLRTLLPPDGELTLRETRNYIAVAFDGSRKWVCRLYVNARKAKSIEFPDGTRHDLNAVGDIALYRDQLMNAYSQKSPKNRKARLLFPMSENAASRYRVVSAETRDNVHLFSRN